MRFKTIITILETIVCEFKSPHCTNRFLHNCFITFRWCIKRGFDRISSIFTFDFSGLYIFKENIAFQANI